MKFLKWLDESLEEVLMCILLVCMACVMIYQIFSRFVLNSSISWGEEVTIYMFIWSTFLGISYCIRKRLTIQIEMLVGAFPEGVQKIVLILVDVVQLAMFTYMIPAAYTYLMRTIASGQVSAALQIPMQYVYAAPLVGFVLTDIRLVQDIYFRVKGIDPAPKKDKTEEAA